MATSQTIALHGGCFSIAGNVTKSLGIVTDIGVNHLDQQGNFGNLFTYMFGPRFSLNHGGRLTPFAQGLVGGARLRLTPLCGDGAIGATAHAVAGLTHW